MGLLNTLKKIFNQGKKQRSFDTNKKDITLTISMGDNSTPDIPQLDGLVKKAIPSEHGLYPHEILALDYASKYYIDRNSFQQFWLYQYGVKNVQALLNSLLERGFLKVGGFKTVLQKQKVVEIKELLKSYNLKRTGKKAELVERALESIPESDLEKLFPRRTYALTELGKTELKNGAYVPYIHRHNIEDLDIWLLNKLVHKPPIMPYRDKIWGYLNKRCVKLSSDNDFGLYRNCRFQMAEFLREENKTKNVLGLLAEVVFIDLSGVGNNFDPEYDIRLENFFPYEKSMATIPPGIISRIVDCQNILGYSDAELKISLFEAMERFHMPIQLFTVEECVQIVFLERDQNKEALEKIYSGAAQKFRKKHHH
ncbi:MAG TPA: SAP domain-containing protein [Bacteroidales bacterium]|nr:SAP domain-containing protein [Bacteroidales bacterium]